MTGKHRNLYLYLALACFLGLILIFVLDGYAGRYDKLEIDNGQRVQTVDFGEDDARGYPSYASAIFTDRGEVLEFTYTLENRWFGQYREDIRVLLASNTGVTELVSGELSVAGFSTGVLEWAIDTAALVPENAEERVNYNAELVINRGGLERIINININTNSMVIRTILPPTVE